jgi:hypothetical protein
MELTTTTPLLKIETKEEVYYSEWPETLDNSEYLLAFRSEWNKKQGIQIWDTILPYNPYDTKISVADIADRYLHFALPEIQKQYPDIAKKLKIRLKNMTKRERDELTYSGIRWYVERQIKEETYYS